ncbi:response regulator [Pontibacter silvestris]|uniref:Response regulator n=1 Tax=Pontibacter silvestris TaxID=2305183 RepID=A0ABW4X0U4_9BACT|nr:response regulator [Pontibacter silvestris]MCC9137482.1 response regulator [Pontibacter silvestris]
MFSYKKVWLIDDDVITNFINERLITLSQFTEDVAIFNTVEEALSLLEETIKTNESEFPDIIFLDISMPGLDGWDFLNAYRMLPKEKRSKCELYMLSSSLDKGDIHMANDYEEVVDFISKPLSQEDLEVIKFRKTNSLEAL